MTIEVRRNDAYGNCKIGQRSQISVGDLRTVASMYSSDLQSAKTKRRIPAVGGPVQLADFFDASCQDSASGYRGQACFKGSVCSRKPSPLYKAL